MHQTLRVIGLFLATVFLGGTVSEVHAATYQFDLSALVDEEGNLPQGLAFDLGTRFSQIESATLKLDGIFTPGEVTLVPIVDPPVIPVPPGPPLAIEGPEGPVGSSVVVSVNALLGDEPLPYWGSPARGWWELTGAAGNVQTELSLDADFSFMLDGVFHLTMQQMQTAALNVEFIEDPHLELTGLVLEITGTAVPEPASAALIAAAYGLAVAWRRGRGAR